LNILAYSYNYLVSQPTRFSYFQPALNSQLLPAHVAAQAASGSTVPADEAGGDVAGAAGVSSAKSSQDESMNQGSPSTGAS